MNIREVACRPIQINASNYPCAIKAIVESFRSEGQRRAGLVVATKGEIYYTNTPLNEGKNWKVVGFRVVLHPSLPEKIYKIFPDNKSPKLNNSLYCYFSCFKINKNRLRY